MMFSSALLIFLLLAEKSSILLCQTKTDSCLTYVHPQYGIGQCIETALCPYSLYQSGLCETKPINVKCCFSMKKENDEFRALWITTAGNVDWPSSKTGTPSQQQTELINILDTVQRLNMNAVIFQVRPAGDAFYRSTLEPWSAYLTGTQNQPPSTSWDPLEFLIVESRKRSIEVHAWINPYRARSSGATYTLSSNHMAKRFPTYAYTYNNYIWMDPGASVVQDFILNVTEDIVRRYEIEGFHMDDYFYPYNDGTDFPDSSTFADYQRTGGQLTKADWRRSNVDGLVQRMSTRLHNIRPKLKFGISPFGIWKSGTPPGIIGLSAYDSIYCDAKKWLQQGWVDYLAPQLYWKIDPPAQSYRTLLEWWGLQSTKGRHIYAGNALYRFASTDQNWNVTEIVQQINITRSYRGQLSLGNVFFSTRQIMQNTKGIQTELSKLYTQKVQTPKMSWLPN